MNCLNDHLFELLISNNTGLEITFLCTTNQMWHKDIDVIVMRVNLRLIKLVDSNHTYMDVKISK